MGLEEEKGCEGTGGVGLEKGKGWRKRGCGWRKRRGVRELVEWGWRKGRVGGREGVVVGREGV